VLVVEDNADAAESLVRLLRLLGHDAKAAHDGRAAVEEAARFRPQIALLDIGLPELSGYDVAREFRSQSWGKQMTLIALTGWGQDEDKRLAKDAGFDRHVVKPINPEELCELLAEPRSGSHGQ
jgi:DNA-binding response OmpR family regulator